MVDEGAQVAVPRIMCGYSWIRGDKAAGSVLQNVVVLNGIDAREVLTYAVAMFFIG